MSKLAILGKYVQAIEDRKRYTFDYSQWLDQGEIIESCTFEVSPVTDPALTVESLINNDTVATWYVAGGTHLSTYLVIIEATTSADQRIRQAIQVKTLDYTP